MYLNPKQASEIREMSETTETTNQTKPLKRAKPPKQRKETTKTSKATKTKWRERVRKDQNKTTSERKIELRMSRKIQIPLKISSQTATQPKALMDN